MPEDTTTTTPTEMVDTTGSETPTVDAQPTADIAAELERTRTALKAANKEAADRRKKLEALEQAETARQQAEMTELDKVKAGHSEIQGKYDALVADYDGLRLRQAFNDATSAANVIFASDQARRDAYELADLAAAIEGGEIDAKAITAALKALQTIRPYLFGVAATSTDIGATRRGTDNGEVTVTDEEVQEFAAKFNVSAAAVDRKALAQAKRMSIRSKQ